MNVDRTSTAVNFSANSLGFGPEIGGQSGLTNALNGEVAEIALYQGATFSNRQQTAVLP